MKKVYVLQKIDYVSGEFSIPCVYESLKECVDFLTVCGWKKSEPGNMFTHDQLHSHVIIHERTIGSNHNLSPYQFA